MKIQQKITVSLGVALAASALTFSNTASAATTLEQVKERDTVKCTIGGAFPGFYAIGKNDEWSGMDIDICRAVAAAVLGDADKAKFTPVQWAQSFTSIKSGETDIMSKGMTWTLSRDTAQGVDFLDTYFYDGQGFMVAKDLGVSSIYDIKGATVCVTTGTSTELNLADFNRHHNMDIKTVVFDDSAVRNSAFFKGSCDVITNDISGLASARSAADDAEDYVILPETISKEALSMAVRQNDSEWANVVKWSFAAMVQAEELGITSANIDQVKSTSKNPVVKRFLGLEGDLHKGLGLDASWAYDIVKQVGNYGEIFDRNLGPNSALKLDRKGTLNALWTDGGMMYSKSFR